MVVGEVEKEGVVGGEKRVNVGGEDMEVGGVREKEGGNIEVGMELDIDLMGECFVGNGGDVKGVEEIVDGEKRDMKIM